MGKPALSRIPIAKVERETSRRYSSLFWSLFSEPVPRIWCLVLLIPAAGLKSYELATDPTIGVLHGSWWLQVAVIEYELFLVAWLGSQMFSRQCRRVVGLTFVAFSSYSMYLAVSGADSCGCFGRVHVSPWLTVVLDSVTLLLVWLWQPEPASGIRNRFPRRIRRALASALLIAAILIPPIGVFSAAGWISTIDGVIPAGSFVVLEPEKWIGKRLPIIDVIDIDERLSEGPWLLVLYHADCEECQEALPKYERLGKLLESRSRVALIQVPPFAARGLREESACSHGRLGGDAEWLVTTPTEIKIKDGQVVEVKNGREVRGTAALNIP